MALQPLVQQYDNDGNQIILESRDLTQITIPDSTGVYSTSNAGGYGTSQIPTSTRRTVDIIKIKIILSFPATPDTLYTILLDGTTTPTAANFAAQTSDLTVDMGDMGGTAGDEFKADGIYSGIYKVYFMIGVASAEYLSADKSLNLSATNWTADYDVVAGSVLDIAGVEYTVLSVSGMKAILVSGTGLVNTTVYEPLVVYSDTFKFLLTGQVERCAIANIPKVISEVCKCAENVKEQTVIQAMLYDIMITSAKASFINEDYEGSQEQIDTLVSQCINADCNPCS